MQPRQQQHSLSRPRHCMPALRPLAGRGWPPELQRGRQGRLGVELLACVVLACTRSTWWNGWAPAAQAGGGPAWNEAVSFARSKVGHKLAHLPSWAGGTICVHLLAKLLRDTHPVLASSHNSQVVDASTIWHRQGLQGAAWRPPCPRCKCQQRGTWIVSPA